jgi:hypothetical protein
VKALDERIGAAFDFFVIRFNLSVFFGGAEGIFSETGGRVAEGAEEAVHGDVNLNGNFSREQSQISMGYVKAVSQKQIFNDKTV